MKKNNSGLLLVGVATSMIALSFPAFAGSTGIFSPTGSDVLALGIAPTAPTPPTAVTVEQGVADAAITSALSANNLNAIADFNAKTAAQSAAFAASEAASSESDATASALSSATLAKSTAASALGSATTSGSAAYDLAQAQATRDALTSSATAAQIASADLLVAQKQAVVNFLTADLTSKTAAETTALAADNAAQVADTAAQNALNTANTELGNAVNTLNNSLSGNTALTAAVTAYNSANDETLSATYADLELIINPAPAAPVDPIYIRNTGLLAAAASSANQNISLASGALTGSAAAVEAGALFETEVLGALVNHEGRITANTAAIVTEAQTRAAEDVRLNNLIVGETAARRADVTRLDGRIDDLTNRVDQFDSRMRSATAVAVAMSGGTFLPNKTMNLTFNMGHYDGKSALSAQINYLVSQNVALNAGVAKGLNKDGKVALRGGVTFGW